MQLCGPRLARLRAVAAVCFVLASGPAGAQSTGGAPPPVPVSSTGQAELSPGAATTDPTAELAEINLFRKGYFDALGVELPFEFLAKKAEALAKATGLQLGLANTMLFMEPGGAPHARFGAAGDLDFLASWTLVGRGSENDGRLVASVEYRYTIGRQTPAVIGPQIGTLISVTSGFNDRGVVLRDFYWIQRLLDARLRILIGRADPSNLVGAHWLQNTNNSFVNRHFSANPAIPFPGHGPTLSVSVVPSDTFYLTAGVSNAHGQTNEIGAYALFRETDYFTFGEMGSTPTFDRLGAGRYAVALWHMDARGKPGLPADRGVTVIMDQRLGVNWQIFARYAYSDATLTNVRQLAQAGLGLRGVLGRPDDFSGAAVSVAIPRSKASRPETVVEIFHRWQMTRRVQFSLGTQVIFDPGNAPQTATAGVFYARVRNSF